MHKVEVRTRFPREKIINFAILAVYFFASAAFTFYGLQPSTSSKDVYAAESATATATLVIPSISLVAPVTPVALNDTSLEVPEQIAGSYSAHPHKTLLLGHSSTIFKNLKNLTLSAQFTYNNRVYTVTSIENLEKSAISMSDILAPAETDTIVLMTCSGDHISGTTNDYTHRLVITAVAD